MVISCVIKGFLVHNVLVDTGSAADIILVPTLSFSLLFPLEDSIKEHYHHTEEETEDVEPCTTVFNPRITKHCDLRGEGVENGVACDLAEGILSGLFFFERDGDSGSWWESL
jgi:hypothetical protein